MSSSDKTKEYPIKNFPAKKGSTLESYIGVECYRCRCWFLPDDEHKMTVIENETYCSLCNEAISSEIKYALVSNQIDGLQLELSHMKRAFEGVRRENAVLKRVVAFYADAKQYDGGFAASEALRGSRR